MEARILELLKDEVDKIHVQMIIQEEMLNVVNSIKITVQQGDENSVQQAKSIAQQKAMLQSSIDINKMTLANLKERIKMEKRKKC